MIKTASQLFAQSLGISCHGKNLCYYCGGSCGAEFPAKNHVKSSFSDTDIVQRPGSEFVCAGCVACLQEKADITLIDGEKRTGQKIRNYSWIITQDSAKAATKSHRERIQLTLVSPPDPPFVLCVSDSGQKHFLPHISRVCHSKRFVTCNLDGEIIVYEPAHLVLRYSLTMQICAVLGKPSLDGLLTTSQSMQVMDYHNDACLVDEWNKVCNEPLTRLALWVTPPKKDCANAYPKTAGSIADTHERGVQATLGWFD